MDVASFLLCCLVVPHGSEPGVVGKSSGLPSGSPWTGRRRQWRWEGKAATLKAEVGTCTTSVGLFMEDYAFSSMVKAKTRLTQPKWHWSRDVKKLHPLFLLEPYKRSVSLS